MQSTEFSKKKDSRELQSAYRYAHRKKASDSERALNQKTKKVSDPRQNV